MEASKKLLVCKIAQQAFLILKNEKTKNPAVV